MDRMVHQFLQTFLQWQMDHSHLIQSNEVEKEKNISYMHKINGLGDQYESRRKQQLRHWIYETFSKDCLLMMKNYPFQHLTSQNLL